MKCLFNIYYINFAKVYEIKMMLGNEISTSKNVEHGENSAVNAQLNGNLKFNLLAKSGGVEGKIQGESSIPFNIKVKVPEGLMWWYYGLYLASWVVSVFLLISIGLLLVTDVKLLQPYSVAGVYALFAAMITTRGWLMHNAHVFNELSKIYTVLSFVMLAEAIVYTVGRG